MITNPYCEMPQPGVSCTRDMRVSRDGRIVCRACWEQVCIAATEWPEMEQPVLYAELEDISGGRLRLIAEAELLTLSAMKSYGAAAEVIHRCLHMMSTKDGVEYRLAEATLRDVLRHSLTMRVQHATLRILAEGDLVDMEKLGEGR